MLQIDNPSPAHQAKVAVLANSIEPLTLLPLLVLAGTFQFSKRNHSTAVIAMQMLALHYFGEAPAEHLEYEGDLEIYRIDIIQGQHLFVEIVILFDEGC